MKIIFCTDPLNPGKVDTDYENEFIAAKELGFEVGLISFEDLVDIDDPSAAIKKLKASVDGETAIYRGWMLKPDKYAELYHALKKKNIELINSPKRYRNCHYLPESYNTIEDYTPRSIWFSKEQISESMDEIYEKLGSAFGTNPVIIKDYVKSHKHEWNEACFIPNASDSEGVRRVVSRFLELQGEDLNEGIVFREFVNLEFLTIHSKSGMPLTKEFRVFFLDGEPLQVFYYWDEGDYGDLHLDLFPFTEIAKKIDSRFFTMDIAKVENGDWLIVELGDGQVSGLPEKANLHKFYENLKEKLRKSL